MFLRFANTTFWWLVITGSQRAWMYCVWLRCFDEPAHTRFMDLCTVAKVSVLLMEEKYHGFYLHCQGSSQYADGDMEEIAKLLENEKNGLATARGLDTDTENMEHVQAFEAHMTAKWRERYDLIYGQPQQRALVFVDPPYQLGEDREVEEEGRREERVLLEPEDSGDTWEEWGCDVL
mgnify:CR=1 FL=1